MDLIDRQALLKQIDIDSDGEPGYYGDTWKFIDTIKSMPSATDKNVGTKLGTNLAELGTDCISRQQAIDAVFGDGRGTIKERLEALPSVQPEIKQQAINSSDCIDRRAAIDALDSEITITGRTNAAVVMGYCKLVKDRLERLPSAQPEPKRGKWHYSDGKPARIGLSFGVVCDQCGTESEYCTNFCGECGADMREVTT